MDIRNARVIYHFDVWGNEEDGFEVNDSRTIYMGPLDFDDMKHELIEKCDFLPELVDTLIDVGCEGFDFDRPNGEPVVSIAEMHDIDF